MKAADFLSQAALIVRERGEVYGDPRANLSDTAARWSATLGHKVTPAQVCLCMVDLKMSRLKASPTHLDSWQDICGYVALLSEIITESTHPPFPLGAVCGSPGLAWRLAGGAPI
jgi:hypothetical protein